ncbi:aminotransferase class I/II-fold pyridoxal phosphate-dependent enzyme [Paraclostridium bifermentans]|nr:aminotransferase class I/II-fold pyridoxal phosphate-dependent enzyme [Paraclostridium bifermentans]
MIFEDILCRKENGSKKWNEDYINRRFPGFKTPFYPLFIADMDYKLPIEIINNFMGFIQKVILDILMFLEKFNESIANWYKKINDIEIDKNIILPGIGTLASMNLVAKTLLNKNDSVLIFTPVYGPFRDIVENNELNLIKQPLKNIKNRYYIDFDELKSNIIKNDIKCVLMCNRIIHLEGMGL